MFDINDDEFPGCCGIIILSEFPSDSLANWCRNTKRGTYDGSKICDECEEGDFSDKHQAYIYLPTENCVTEAGLEVDIREHLETGKLHLITLQDKNSSASDSQTRAQKVVRKLGFKKLATWRNSNHGNSLTLFGLQK